MTARALDGSPLTPGVNADRIDIPAGVREAEAAGYATAKWRMVTEYALCRWARGEEDGALRTFMSGGIDLTSAYRIVAAARAGAQ